MDLLVIAGQLALTDCHLGCQARRMLKVGHEPLLALLDALLQYMYRMSSKEQMHAC